MRLPISALTRSQCRADDEDFGVASATARLLVGVDAKGGDQGVGFRFDGAFRIRPSRPRRQKQNHLRAPFPVKRLRGHHDN